MKVLPLMVQKLWSRFKTEWQRDEWDLMSPQVEDNKNMFNITNKCSDKCKYKTRHVFVKHGCPRWQQCQNMAKISKSYILTPPNPQGHGLSVKCEEPIDELTVQVWLLYHHPNFKYCTLCLFVNGTELRTDRWTDRRTDRQTDGQTDDPITRCPRRTFQAGGIKIISLGWLC